MAERIFIRNDADRDEALTVSVSQDKSATHCAFVNQSRAHEKQDRSSNQLTRLPSVVKLKAAVGRGHKAVRDALESSVSAARETGELLLQLKERVPRGEWGSVLEQLAQEYGLTKRTAQFYMQTAKKWEEISRTHTGLEDCSLRLIQKILAKPRTEDEKPGQADEDSGNLQNDPADRTAVRGDNNDVPDVPQQLPAEPPPEIDESADNDDVSDIRQVVLAYFGGRIDVEVTVAGTSAMSRTPGQPDGSPVLPIDWSGNVFCRFADTDMVTDLVGQVIDKFDKQSIAEAILLLPARLNAPWLRQFDRYPRVFVDPARAWALDIEVQPLMLVGVVRHESALEFHKAFKTIGSVFYPITFLFEDLES